MSAEPFCACTHGVYAHTKDGCAVKGCGCTKYVPVHETDRRSIQEREDAAREEGLVAWITYHATGFADCEALVSAGLLALAEKEDKKTAEEGERVCELAGWPYSPPEFLDWISDNETTFWYADWAGKIETPTPTVGHTIDLSDLRAFWEAFAKWDFHRHRAACLHEMSRAVLLGRFRTAKCNERAIIAAHRDAAGFNPSKAGGEARSRKLSPQRRREIAANAGRAKKGFGKLSPAQRRFLARAHAESGTFHLSDEDAATPQRASGWWRTARSLAKRGIVEFVPGANVGPAPAACKLTDAARARWAANKGE